MIYGVVVVVVLLVILGTREVFKRRKQRELATILDDTTRLPVPFSWYCISITEEMVAEGAELMIIQNFIDITVKAGKGEALFVQAPGDGLEHSIFFTPDAAMAAPSLVSVYSGRPCEAPSRRNVEYLVGDEAARRLLAS